MKRWVLLVLFVLLALPVLAQDATETPTPDAADFPFAFPLDIPTEAQIDDAYDCILLVEQEDDADLPDGEITPACGFANAALALAAERASDAPLSDEELALLVQMIEANPAMALRLSLIATYFGATPLVAAPEFSSQSITDIHLTYTFAGMGPSNNYDIRLSAGDGAFDVSGTAEIRGDDDQPTLAATVDSDTVQALATGLTDLLPIGQTFTAINCLDYYPDWSVELTFADGTTITMATHDSNVIGYGGPWQTNIDGQTYVQYSPAFMIAVADLFDALGLPFGVTAGMACMGVGDPLYDAFPREASDT